MNLLLENRVLLSVLLVFFGAMLCESQSLTLTPTKSQVVGGTPGGGLIVGQTHCDSSGNIYFRQLQGGKIVLSPVVEISADGTKSHVFDFLTQATKELRGFTVNDFTVDNGTLYLTGTAGDTKVHVLEYSADDGELTNALVVDDSQAPGNVLQGGLTASKIGVMPSGELLIFGVRTSREDLPNTAVPRFSYKPVLELYDKTGRFIKAIKFKSDQVDLNDKGHPQEDNFAALDLALSANGPDGVYLVVYSNKPTVYVVSPEGEVGRKLNLEPIGKEYRPISLSVSSGQMLLEFVKSSDGTPETAFVAYDTNSGEKGATYRLSDAVNGIFSCFDGRRTFTFVSTDGLGQRTIKYADAR